MPEDFTEWLSTNTTSDTSPTKGISLKPFKLKSNTEPMTCEHGQLINYNGTYFCHPCMNTFQVEEFYCSNDKMYAYHYLGECLYCGGQVSNYEPPEKKFCESCSGFGEIQRYFKNNICTYCGYSQKYNIDWYYKTMKK